MVYKMDTSTDLFTVKTFIYKLEWLENGRVYIGKSYRPETRKKTHITSLRCGKHPVALLQADYDRYGEAAFVFTVLEEVDRQSVGSKNGSPQYADSLREKELMIQYKSYLPEYGYNYNDHYFHPVWGPHRKFKHTDKWMPKKQRLLKMIAQQ